MQPTQPTLEQVKAAASEMLQEASASELTSRLTHGANRVSVCVRAGDVEVTVEVSGPGHSHDEDEGAEWDDEDELFADDED